MIHLSVSSILKDSKDKVPPLIGKVLGSRKYRNTLDEMMLRSPLWLHRVAKKGGRISAWDDPGSVVKRITCEEQ